MIRRDMRAMNTDVLILIRPNGVDDESVLNDAVDTIEEYEARFSRFRETSDLSRLNNSHEEEVSVTPELAQIVDRALTYAGLTDGIFDPVVLAELKSAGYDRSFEQVAADQVGGTRGDGGFRWHDVSVDLSANRIRRPLGAQIDLGGIAKGAAADAACSALVREAGALVDLGGDIRTAGQPDDANNWGVGLDDGSGNRRAIVKLESEAVATSSVRKRSWTRNGRPAHHIIDPRTGVPAASTVAQCSVIADTAEHAEIAAKVALILGEYSIQEGDEVAHALGLRGLCWITLEGVCLATPGWRARCA